MVDNSKAKSFKLVVYQFLALLGMSWYQNFKTHVNILLKFAVASSLEWRHKDERTCMHAWIWLLKSQETRVQTYIFD